MRAFWLEGRFTDPLLSKSQANTTFLPRYDKLYASSILLVGARAGSIGIAGEKKVDVVGTN